MYKINSTTPNCLLELIAKSSESRSSGARIQKLFKGTYSHKGIFSPLKISGLPSIQEVVYLIKEIHLKIDILGQDYYPH